jgi:hypothetical protein
MRQTEKRK